MVALRALVCAAALGLGGPAGAHSWYDPWCCDGGDCGPATVAGFVAAGLGGTPRMQLTNHRGTATVDSNTRFLPSQDSKLHACIWFGKLRCVYLPPGQ